MKIIEILKERSESPKDEKNKIELKLYTLADTIEKMAREHLTQVTTVLPEFDLHDASHSEKVIQNIEELIGDEKLKELSVCELFLLHLSAFLHDCAMAPATWELDLMKLTEGTDKFFETADSIKNDMKPAYKHSEAMTFIKEKKIYDSFDEASKWPFTPAKEKDLIEELAQLLVEYQEFRNGFKSKFEKVISNEEFASLNRSVRIDFIRCNHHLRIESYIKNLSKEFEKQLKHALGKRLSKDLAIICRAHGEDSSYISDMEIDTSFFGAETTNLQFVARLLRLGDIIHFSFDRAPVVISSSKIFKSEYSFQQWAIKDNAVTYSITDKIISFKAFCDDPNQYFKLHEYVDWIDEEIENFHRFTRLWDKKYNLNLPNEVNRKSIKNDDDVFQPQRGLKFKLDQKHIIELLMGVGLYKDKYACLRELYQNSLDACRSLQAKLDTDGNQGECSIEFGLERDEDKNYLYCKDSGIGMTKDIIENYLLNIGNSYYKSSDFFKKQAQWGGGFTPTSQFGIGILSCFMIGSQIDITTKNVDDEVISCAIDGPHESFYYKKVGKVEEEEVGRHGTIVKVLLSEEITNKLNNKALDKLGLLLLNNGNVRFNKPFESYKVYYENWSHHLYNKINAIVGIPFQNIPVFVINNNNSRVEVLPKPMLFKCDQLGVSENDLDFINSSLELRHYDTPKYQYSEVRNWIDTYALVISKSDVDYNFSISLPKKGYPFDSIDPLLMLPILGDSGICIDGISISANIGSRSEFKYLSSLEENGVVNFTGSLRPQLSVDRTSITSWPEKQEELFNDMTKELFTLVIDTIKKHISKNNIDLLSNTRNIIWQYMFEKFDFGSSLFIDELAASEYGSIYWDEFDTFLESKMTIKEFIYSKCLTILTPNKFEYSSITTNLILGKLCSAKKISVKNDSVEILSDSFYRTKQFNWDEVYRDQEDFIMADSWNVTLSDYDIISDLLPVIPKYVFDSLIEGRHLIRGNTRVKRLTAYGNGICSFFKQDPALINEKLGLFTSRSFFNEKIMSIYNFQQKVHNFGLSEINTRTNIWKEKKVNVLFVFINARELTSEELSVLKEYETSDPTYVKGVKEGWSLLFTGKNEMSLIIKAGIQKREDMVSLIPPKFWETYKDIAFSFLDGTPMEQK
jgi:molecular chaperone HtpG